MQIRGRTIVGAASVALLIAGAAATIALVGGGGASDETAQAVMEHYRLVETPADEYGLSELTGGVCVPTPKGQICGYAAGIHCRYPGTVHNRETMRRCLSMSARQFSGGGPLPGGPNANGGAGPSP